MKVLGIDPGFGRLGYGIVQRSGGSLRALEFGCVETSKEHSMPQRLRQIHHEMTALIERSQPDCLATEALLFAANRTTAFDVCKALGVVLLASAELNLAWCEYTPPQVKLAVTGSGSADKKQMRFMVQRLLSLTEAPKLDDVTDALAVAICHSLKARVLSAVP